MVPVGVADSCGTPTEPTECLAKGKDFPYQNLCVDDPAHPFNRPSPKIGTKEQSALSSAGVEPKAGSLWRGVSVDDEDGFQERAATEHAQNRVDREFPLVRHVFQSGA
jgi:hypothetical protein